MEEKLVELLGRLESAVTDAAPHVWGIAVRNAVIEGWVHIGWTVFAIAVTSAMAALTWWLYKIAKTDPEEAVGVCFGALLVMVASGIAVHNGLAAMELLVNPEMRALVTVRGLLR